MKTDTPLTDVIAYSGLHEEAYCASLEELIGGLARQTSSQLREPDKAPRDGTMILAAVGWPWLVPAVWDEDSNEWAVVTVEACPLKTGAVNRYWENDAERPRNLLGWLPWPQLHGGYVFRPANVEAGLPERHCSEYIFEIVDVSDEEVYYTIGVFLSLEKAVAAIEAKAEPWTLCESAMFSGEYAAMEIRQKTIGVLDPLNNGDVVWSRKWVNQYAEDSDDDEWIIVPNAIGEARADNASPPQD